MPSFCRHNHLIQNCPICAREQDLELRPVVSSSAPRVSQPPPATPGASRTRRQRATSGARASGSGGVRVRQLVRGTDDGFRSPRVPGLKSSVDAERLAEDISLGAYRIERLEHDPPGLYAEVADSAGELEERTWLAFQIAFFCPLDGDEPFAEIEAARTRWASGENPALEDVKAGPRTAYDPARGGATFDAYRAWAARAGSQAAAFGGEAGWTPERRFARVFERLALPGLHRDARYDLLVTLGRLGVYELRAGALQFGGENAVTVAAKRALGIGDPLLLERRAAELATACEVPLEALDLALYNWDRGARVTLGLSAAIDPELGPLDAVLGALGLERAE